MCSKTIIKTSSLSVFVTILSLFLLCCYEGKSQSMNNWNGQTVSEADVYQADIECQNKFGSGYHGVPSSKDQAHVSLGGNTPSNNKISSEVEVNLGILKGKLGSEASDGSVSSEGWAQCVQD